jgi:hypothetical protein
MTSGAASEWDIGGCSFPGLLGWTVVHHVLSRLAS